MARNTLIAFLSCLLVAAPAAAERLYKWVDPSGNVTYQDRPPPPGMGGRVEEKILRDKAGGGDDPSLSAIAAKTPVTLYVTTKCAPCDLARAYLKGRKVPYTEIDVSEKNPDAQKAMREKVGELAVPTILVGTKVMKGYMESLLEGELDQAGYPKQVVKTESAEGQEGAAQ
jgi:glutaredoxin